MNKPKEKLLSKSLRPFPDHYRIKSYPKPLQFFLQQAQDSFTSSL